MKRTKLPSANSLNPSGGLAGSTEPTISSQTEAGSHQPNESKDLPVPPLLLEGDEPKETTIAGPGQKFVTSSGSGIAEEVVLGDQLPEAYGTGHLFLAARDPRCLYAHWDFSKEQQQRHTDLSSDHYLLLRVHQENLDGPLVAELRIHPESHHSFVNVSVPNGRYVADLGYFSAGAWKSIAKSNPTVSPIAHEQSASPVRFATLNFPEIPVAKPGSQESTAVQLEPSIEQPTCLSDTFVGFPLPPTSQPFRIPNQTIEFSDSHPPESAPVYAGPFVQVAGTAAQIEPVEEESVEANAWTGPFPVSATQWTAAKERALAEIIGLSLIQQRWLNSQEIEEVIRGEFRGEIFPAEISSIEAAVGRAVVSSEAMVGRPVAERGFWFNVNAELVIYGATESNATVTIAGRPIRLRPDGTFSYRFALPDGNYRLPVRAISSDGEMRQAELEFHRGTVYSGDVKAHPQDSSLKPPTVENVS